MFSPLRSALALAALITLSACGQKGPLYLPQEESAAPTTETRDAGQQ